MQPIRVHEKDHWKSVNRRLFSKRKENVQIAYTIELNDKVEKAYKGWGSELTGEISLVESGMKRFFNLNN